jgi:hypothetical protein
VIVEFLPHSLSLHVGFDGTECSVVLYISALVLLKKLVEGGNDTFRSSESL